MKITIKQIRQIVNGVILESAADGEVQSRFRNSFKRMIKLASKGGTKSSPPYTKPPTMGTSGPPGNP